jgi:hypothetical protein
MLAAPRPPEREGVVLGTLLKGYAYTRNPKLTFTALHPVRALQLRKIDYDLEHAFAPRLTAIAAAAVALPLGVWLGRHAAAHDRVLHRRKMRTPTQKEVPPAYEN